MVSPHEAAEQRAGSNALEASAGRMPDRVGIALNLGHQRVVPHLAQGKHAASIDGGWPKVLRRTSPKCHCPAAKWEPLQRKACCVRRLVWTQASVCTPARLAAALGG